jgi:nitrogen regulatory protein PII
MKLITAIIQPDKLGAVQKALEKAGVSGLTQSFVQGFGNQKGYTESYRGKIVKVNIIDKVKIEVAAKTKDVKSIVEAIVASARSGKKGSTGDGKIFITDITDVIRIRTGERGEDAI